MVISLTTGRDGRAGGREDGLTLLEVMLALSISSLVLLTVVYGLRLAYDTWAGVRQRSEIFHAYQNLYRQLYFDLHSVAGRTRSAGPMPESLLDGGTDWFSMLVLSGPYDSARVRYRFDPRDKTVSRSYDQLGALRREADRGRADGVIEEALARNVKVFRVEYFDGETGTWLSSWDGRYERHLPTSVRVMLEFGSSARNASGALVFPPGEIDVPIALSSGESQ